MYGNMLTLNGNAETVSLQLSFCGINLSSSEAVELLNYIISHNSLLGEGESAEKKILFSTLTKTRKKDVYYFINVTMLNFALAVWLCGRFEDKLEELMYSILYLPSDRIIRLDENGGEVCLTKQSVLKNGKTASREIFVPNNGICVNPELNCKFKDGEECRCKKADAEDILWELTRKGAFARTRNAYKLNW